MEIKKLIESIRAEFKDSLDKDISKEESCDAILTLRIPRKYKSRFDELQTMSDRQFGKALKVLTCKLIDSVG